MKMSRLDEDIEETKEIIRRLKVDVSIMPREDSMMLRQDLWLKKEYLKRLLVEKKGIGKRG